jgi:outer membrane receptor for ferrienterochelin and colicin
MLTLKKLAGGAATTALLVAIAGTATAQETTSAIRGEVVDAGGAPVAGAQVTILHQPSGTRSTAATDPQGKFSARGLRVGGPYQITVAGPGFEPETLQGINLTVGETTDLNFDLASAEEVEALVVTARRDPTANNTGANQVLARDNIEAVASISRDIRDLARRNLLTSQDAVGNSQGISIAGSNPRNNRVTIDGAQAQDDFGLNTGGLQTLRGPVSLDAIEQFSVSAVPVDVENGDFSGGALDIVLRKGGNRFRGSAFVNYFNDGMIGDSIRGEEVDTTITQKNYGGFLSGPIVRDKLFFALSYEKYESATQTDTGFAGQGFANEFIGITPAQVQEVKNIFDTNYASTYVPGDLVRSTPILDEKYTIGLDWNITDRQRASFTARYALSELTTRTDLSRQTAALSDHYYLAGEEDYSYAFELNSEWTNNFNTQLRITYRDYERRQDPLGDDDFADITVCLAPTSINVGGDSLTSCGTNSVVRFGPDINRQANFLETSNAQVQFKGEYSLGDHLFKFGYQGQRTAIFNIFVPTSDGQYYFDSVADFRAGRANRLQYNNAITGNPLTAAADFEYDLHSVFAQDTLEVTDTLTLTGGFRLDTYVMADRPANNPNFFNRRGFSNQETYDDQSIFMPRFSFEYEPFDFLDLRGGFGLFSGGVPDVFISNSFSNTGILSASVDIQRNADGTFREANNTSGFTQGTGATALNVNLADPRFGFDIPTPVLNLQGGAVVPAGATVNAIVPGFQFPSDWKRFLTAAVEAPDGWSDGFAPTFLRPALEDWRLTFDAVFTKVRNSYKLRDFRAEPLVVLGQRQFTPDGRLRYDGLGATTAQRNTFGISSSNPGNNTDLVALNTDLGESYTIGVGLQREFRNGLSLSVGYARQDLEDQNSGARFASTANSLYNSAAAGLDPNEEAFGTSPEEIKNRYKFEVGYRRNFIGDLETRFNLFGEIRDGRPTSYVMDDGVTGRSPTFGVNRDNHLLYVPDFRNDPNPNDLNVGFVTFADQATYNNFRRAVEYFKLEQGAIQGKGTGRESPEIYLIDAQISQDLPGILRDHRTRLVFDIQNVLNLLNDEWGVVEQFNDQTRIVSAQCADANGAVSPAGSPVCARYRYSNFNQTALVKDRNIDRSLWRLQVSLRYEF